MYLRVQRCHARVLPFVAMAAELIQAATHYDRAAALQPAPAVKAALAEDAARCRGQADAM